MAELVHGKRQPDIDRAQNRRELDDSAAASGARRAPPEEGAIDFVRLASLPGIEAMDVRNVSRRWAYFHETYTFCVASRVQGMGDVPWKYRRRTYVMGVDRVQLMEPGEFHANLSVVPPADFRVLMVAPALLTKVARELGWERSAPPHFRTGQLDDGPVRRVLQKLAAAIVEQGDPERGAAGVHALVRALSETRNLEISLPTESRRASLKAALWARDIIHDRWNERFPVQLISKETRVPLSSLERTFTETFGTSPRHYQNHVRLMRGKELLANTAGSVAAIAKTCGFSDPKYFARLFRREFARSPLHYRRANPE